MPRRPAIAATKTCIPWFLYLLECEDGSLYAGVALDVEARFIHHVLGLGAAYTRSHPPLRVLAVRCCANRGEALRTEYALKQLPRACKLSFFETAERLADAQLSDVTWRKPRTSPGRDDSAEPRQVGLIARF